MLLEQVAVLNNNRFGKSSEKLDTENQICLIEVDGSIDFFNEAEAVASLDEYADEDATKPKGKDSSQSFMIICIRSSMIIMCFKQMGLWFRSQKKTEPMGIGITCGCIVLVRCMRTDRSYCTITSLRVMQAIQEISSRSSGGLCNRWLPSLSYHRKGT